MSLNDEIFNLCTMPFCIRIVRSWIKRWNQSDEPISEQWSQVGETNPFLHSLICNSFKEKLDQRGTGLWPTWIFLLPDVSARAGRFQAFLSVFLASGRPTSFAWGQKLSIRSRVKKTQKGLLKAFQFKVFCDVQATNEQVNQSYWTTAASEKEDASPVHWLSVHSCTISTLIQRYRRWWSCVSFLGW